MLTFYFMGPGALDAVKYLAKKYETSVRRIFSTGKAFDGIQWKHEGAQVRCLAAPIDFPSKDLLFKNADGLVLAPGFEPPEGLLEHLKAHTAALEQCERAIIAPAGVGPFKRADSDAQKLFEVLFRQARDRNPATGLRGQSLSSGLNLDLGGASKSKKSPFSPSASRRTSPGMRLPVSKPPARASAPPPRPAPPARPAPRAPAAPPPPPPQAAPPPPPPPPAAPPLPVTREIGHEVPVDLLTTSAMASPPPPPDLSLDALTAEEEFEAAAPAFEAPDEVAFEAPAPAQPKPELVIPDENAFADVSGAPDAEVEGHLDRKTTVRYYRRMTQHKNHPLLVVFSKESIGQVQGVTQVEGGGVRVKADNTIVSVIPVFPGCLTAPNRVEVDIKPETVEVRLWLTPITLGNIKEARVEIWQDGRFLDQILTPCRLTRHFWTKVSGALSIAAPISRYVLPLWGINLDAQAKAYALAHWPQIHDLITRAEHVEVLWGGAFCVLTLIVFLSLRTKLADPVQKKFTLQQP